MHFLEDERLCMRSLYWKGTQMNLIPTYNGFGFYSLEFTCDGGLLESDFGVRLALQCGVVVW
jgi:hypothetical protein